MAVPSSSLSRTQDFCARQGMVLSPGSVHEAFQLSQICRLAALDQSFRTLTQFFLGLRIPEY